jgi:hypothetical protein
MMEREYKLFEVHHNLAGSRRTPSLSRGQVPKSNEHTKTSVNCFAWRLRGSLKGWHKSLLGSLNWSEAWGRESLSSRSVGSKGFQVSGVAKWANGAWSSFYSPQKESSHWGVQDPDMSDQGTRYVWERLLEPSLGIGHVQCRDITRFKTRRPDISGPRMCPRNVTRTQWPDQISPTKGLSCCEYSVDRTCPVQEPDMSSIAYWNPATDPDKSGKLEGLEWPGHVRAGGQICPTKHTRTRSGDQICLDFLASWIGRCFLMICTSPTYSMHPPWQYESPRTQIK